MTIMTISSQRAIHKTNDLIQNSIKMITSYRKIVKYAILAS